MKEQSDTPRTDAEVYTADGYGLNVDAHFARRLERELTTATRERDKARAEVEGLRKTLDEIATYWNGSHRPAETLDAAEWTQGVAEEALAATEAKPVNPDGLPTYDKEKALEWVAQLRDGNKEAKP